jgi:3-isopropylmalate/(R)-2-methylmalate dehydratase large subunit
MKTIGEVTGVPVNIAELVEALEDVPTIFGSLPAFCEVIACRLKFASKLSLQWTVYKTALKEGLIEALHDAGAVIFPPSAGSNQAVNMGAMAEAEVMISNQARNFPGRNGHPKARHYLASAATVAMSALKGKIADPRNRH